MTNNEPEFSVDRSEAIRTALIEHAAVSAATVTRKRPMWRSVALVLAGAVAGASMSAAAYAASSADGPSGEGTTEPPATHSATFGSEIDVIFNLPGFVSFGAGPTAHSVEILWAGEPDADALAAFDAITAAGTTVYVKQAGHDPAEFDQAAKKLVAALLADGIDVTGFGPDRYYTAIELLGPELSFDPDVQARADHIAADLLGDAYVIRYLPDEIGCTYLYDPNGVSDTACSAG